MSPTAAFVRSVLSASPIVAASAFAVHTASGGGTIREFRSENCVMRWLEAVTPDGRVFAGYDSTGGFRWSESGGFERLESIPSSHPGA